MVQPCDWFKEESSQFSMGQTAQSLTCSIMEKPHTGLDECPRILLSCFRARNSSCRPSSATDFSCHYFPPPLPTTLPINERRTDRVVSFLSHSLNYSPQDLALSWVDTEVSPTSQDLILYTNATSVSIIYYVCPQVFHNI